MIAAIFRSAMIRNYGPAAKVVESPRGREVSYGEGPWATSLWIDALRTGFPAESLSPRFERLFERAYSKQFLRSLFLLVVHEICFGGPHLCAIIVSNDVSRNSSRARSHNDTS